MGKSADGAAPYKVCELAKRLGCSEQHVRHLTRTGVIPGGFRVSPRCIRFDRALVDQWLEERKKAGGGQS